MDEFRHGPRNWLVGAMGHPRERVGPVAGLPVAEIRASIGPQGIEFDSICSHTPDGDVDECCCAPARNPRSPAGGQAAALRCPPPACGCGTPR